MENKRVQTLAEAIVEEFCMGFDENHQFLLQTARYLYTDALISRAELDYIEQQSAEAVEDEKLGEKGEMRHTIHTPRTSTPTDRSDTVKWLRRECADKANAAFKPTIIEAANFLEDYWEASVD